MTLRRRAVLSAMGLVALVVAVAACGDTDDDEVNTGVTTTSAAVATTKSPAATTRPTIEEQPDAASTPDYGDACALGSLPDCIDPDGDGQGTYLKGGANCVRRFSDSPELCNDLDGDGTAGYPDSG